MSVDLERIAGLLRQRNALDERIAAVIDRPMTAGHLGEWIAAHIFHVELEQSAVAAAIDGRFASGPLRGRTVNCSPAPHRQRRPRAVGPARGPSQRSTCSTRSGCSTSSAPEASGREPRRACAPRTGRQPRSSHGRTASC
ncbi:hypothetical protein FRAHR75_290069 [Frankia sp. Hr75.2]|nr:hypothetical protein FRAHR75_290069 [Frankia sp. Hr75.2]